MSALDSLLGLIDSQRARGLVIAVGEPRQVPRTLQPAVLEQWQKDMAAEMKRLFGIARDALDGKVAA